MGLTRHVTAETTSWASQQKPSLLVVLGNGPFYSHLSDPFGKRHAQFFSNPDDVTVIQRVWQLAPAGAGNYTSDIRSFSAKVFDSYQEFIQQYRSSPRTVTDYTAGNADVFHGHDVYGWPPEPVPFYWSPQQTGTQAVTNAFPGYQFQNDIFLLKPQAKFFDTYQEYFTPTPILAQGLNTYLTYLDFSWVKPQAKVFDTYQEFYRNWQQATSNAIFNFVVYNPGTDVTLLKQQAKYFDEFVPFWGPQPLTRNVLENLPPPYDFRSMFFFRRNERYFPELDPNFFSITQKGSLAAVISPLLIMPNLIGLDLATAENVVLGIGLQIGSVVYEDITYWEISPPTPYNPTGPFPAPPRNIVIGQWPEPGSITTVNYPVLIVVSTGRNFNPGTNSSTGGNTPNTVQGSTTFP